MRLVDAVRSANYLPEDANLWHSWVQQTYGKPTETPVLQTFQSYAERGHGGNGVVFGLMLARAMLFSEATFQWRNKTTKELFGNTELATLEDPWPNGTTGELLARMIQDADLAGNAFIRRDADRLVRLRPDWVDFVLVGSGEAEERSRWDVLGYTHWLNGPGSQREFYPVDEVAHWSPIPDPLSDYRGMSWLTPVVREINADLAMTDYKRRFMDNSAPQPLDAKILTPTGWSTMGAMDVGSEVIGSDGKPHRVVGVFPQGEREIYRVKFSDGSAVECTDDHLWQVANYYDRQRSVNRKMTLRQIMDGGFSSPGGLVRWSVPFVDPVEFDDPGPLAVHPYLLGALLGDGSFRSNGKGSGGVSLAAARDDADETEDILAPLLPDGVTISRRDRGGWSEFYFRGTGGPKANPLTSAIKSLGLWDHLGYEKFIPDAYMRASVTERVALMQGLIDTDGCVSGSQGNTTFFTSTSSRLAHQLAELALSLGGSASVHGQERKGGRPQWVVRISRLPDWITPCRLSRKAGRYSPKFRGGRWRYMVSAEMVRSAPAQCIAVDVSDHLYVTNDFILTHNTPNLLIKYQQKLTPGALDRVREVWNARYGGTDGQRTAILDSGADHAVIGSTLQAIDFANVQAAGENRIAVAAGVPGIVAGLKEGLAAATYSNYEQAMRRLADITMRPLWRSACACLASILTVPAGAKLWYDTSDIAALRQGEKERAETMAVNAVTANTLITAGFTKASVVAAITSGDLSQLKDTGLVSVQLQKPGSKDPTTPPVADMTGEST